MKETTSIYVYTRSILVESEDERPDDDWGYTVSIYDSYVTSVEVCDEEYAFKTFDGIVEKVYVVLYEYWDGSTFSNDEGLIEVLDVFRTKEEASRLLERVESAMKTGESYLKSEDSDKIYCLDIGYFGGISDVYYKEFSVKR